MSDQTDSPEPPPAKRVPSERTHHGDTFVDDYAWLTAKDDAATIEFLEAQNRYTESLTASQESLREAVFAEI
ncbi:MAG: hypothetical protein J2P27_13160, partial [Actinobacteria bacterium]|nr:hypothetical protein [Actinomycetota bacterium]